jgi:hypothetical protein
VAAWLVARPQNGVVALAATLVLPAPQFTSGVIVVLLVLAQGVRMAVIQALIAGAFLAVLGLFWGYSLGATLTGMLLVWAPLVFLAMLLLTTRSLALTLQVSVLLMAVVVVGFYLTVSDPVAFWQPIMDKAIELWRQSNMQEQAELMAAQPEAVAELATVVAAWSGWTVYVVSLLWGYWLYSQLPGETRSFGRFQDLNFGRVIAMTLVLAIVLGVAFGANWLLNIALVLFAVFWLQGLAILHFVHGQGYLPVFGLIAAYALLPFLHVVLVMSLAFAGYTDAWFGFRKRMAASR